MAPIPRAKILAIDGDQGLRRMITRALGEFDALAADGAEALRLLRAGQRYDLILCDVGGDAISGVEIFGAVDAVDPDQASRFVFTTAGPSSSEEVDFLSATKLRVVEKPFTMRTLGDIVAEELRVRRR